MPDWRHRTKAPFPNGGRLRAIERSDELRGLIQVMLGAEQQVGDDVRIDDGFHARPAEIQASTSEAAGRRV